MDVLRIVSYLGDNTVPIVGELAMRIGEATGLRTTSGSELTWPERHALVDADGADIYWMCGLLTAELVDAGRLDADIVAAPVFRGQDGPWYHSVIVASTPADSMADLAGRRLAVNEDGSWSGHHALRAHLARAGLLWHLFAEVVQSGGHERSIDMLLAGDSDVASIDHTVWEERLARDPAVATLWVIERTQDWWAPPFSVARSMDAGLRATVIDALLTARPHGLAAIVPAIDADYDPMRRAVGPGFSPES